MVTADTEHSTPVLHEARAAALRQQDLLDLAREQSRVEAVLARMQREVLHERGQKRVPERFDPGI